MHTDFFKATRRTFLKLGCAAGAAAAVAPVQAAASQSRACDATPNQGYLALPYAPSNGSAQLGLYGRDTSMLDICRQVLPGVIDTAMFKNASVFVKVACNSGAHEPAVTSPDAVRGLVAYLAECGAATIYVGDQAGVESVRLLENRRHSSTQKLMARNGLLDAIQDSGATVHCFDDYGWSGYFQPQDDFGSSWTGGIYLPAILQDVDHVIYLPRLGSHTLAGYSCGIKNAVGFLRDDSRQLLHQQGPLYYRRYPEISHFEPLRSKLRLVLTLATQALGNMGPDFGEVYDFGGTLALASKSLVDHDYVASLLLPWCNAQALSCFDVTKLLCPCINFMHVIFVGGIWGLQGLRGYQRFTKSCFGGSIEEDAAISHMAVLQGYRPKKIDVATSGNPLPQSLSDYLTQASSGFLQLPAA